MRVKKKNKKDIRKENPIKTIPYIASVVVLVCFVVGILPLKPVAIVSNSMKPIFKRGDICIVENIEGEEEINQIKVGDIIEYQGNNQKIVHRVISINKNTMNITFITKGDNNKDEDILPVEAEQIIARVKFTIPYFRLSIRTI